MSNASLGKLEHDVELARKQLSDDLFTLRSPTTMSEFADGLKREAVQAKDILVEKARSTIQSTAQDFVEDLKAKAAANPMAALAIGAGLGWQFLRRPPIATTLVAAGLFSLLRTSATQPDMNGQGDQLAYAKDRLKQQAGEVVAKVGDLASDAVEKVKEHAGELAGAVGEQMRNVSAQHPDTLDELKKGGGEVVERAAALANQASSAVNDAVGDPQIRDNLLLGVAGMAVAAAMGLAYRRRVQEQAGD